MMELLSLSLLFLGMYGLITKHHVLKMIVSMNVMEIGLNLFITSLGYQESRLAPILSSKFPSSALNFVDPLPQSLVLTSIVIGVGTTAVALAFAKKIYMDYGTLDLEKIEGRL